MPPSQAWEIRLADTAKADLRGIVGWTARHFGDQRAKAYSEMISSALRSLKAGPDTIGVRSRSELGEDVFILPIARPGKRGRHLILFRAVSGHGTKSLQILRVLHDAMDLPRHLPER